MKPSSAMSLASRRLGHSALSCAMAGVDFAIVAASAAIAAEQSRSRFVSIGTCPSGSRLLVGQDRGLRMTMDSCALCRRGGRSPLPRDAAGPVHATGADDPWRDDRRGHHSWGNDSGSDGAPRDDGTARTRAAGPVDARGRTPRHCASVAIRVKVPREG